MTLNFFTVKKIKLRNLLLITYVLIVSLTLAVQIWSNEKLVGAYEGELRKTNMQLVNEVMTNMQYNLKELIGLSMDIYFNKEYLAILEKSPKRTQYEKVTDAGFFQNYIQQIIYHNYVRGIYIYSVNGDSYYGNCNNGFRNINENLSHDSWLRSLIPKDSDIVFLSTHHPQQLLSGLPVFSLVRKIKDPNRGLFLGLMLIDIDPNLLRTTYESKVPQWDGQILVTDSGRRIIHHTVNKLNMTLLKGREFDPIYQSARGNFICLQSGVKYLVSFDTSPLTHWKVIVATPLENIQHNASRIRNTILWIALLLLIFSFAISILFSTLISSPIKNLTRRMERIGKGNWDAAETVAALNGTRETHLLNTGFNTMIAEIKSLLKNEYELKLLKKDAELKALQAQINPHFLYNTLESISALADLKKVPEVGKTCRILSNMFRYAIGAQNDFVPIQHEIEHVKDYFAIMKFRFGEQLELNFDIDAQIAEFGIIKLTLQPLIENCINHGFRGVNRKYLMTLHATQENQQIVIEISDNGVGIPADKLAELRNELANMNAGNFNAGLPDYRHSIGIKNIQLRFIAYFGPESGIQSIESAVGVGTKIRLHIPVIEL